MNKRMRYGRLEAIEFELYISDIMDMLRKTGEIPEGFMLDTEEMEGLPVKLSVKRYIADPTTEP